MTFEDYQEKAARTCNFKKPSVLLTLALGLGGEAGECQDIIKKFGEGRGDLDIEHLDEELGDVLWYWVNLCTFLQRDPANVAERNIAKLEKRYPGDGADSRLAAMFQEGKSR